jgi:hypothetical protein
MYCDRCGTRLPPTVRFCSTCGKSFAPTMPQYPVAPRVAGNIRTLGILWIVYSLLHMVPGILVGSVFRWLRPEFEIPFFVHGIVGLVTSILMVKGVVGIIAGWGLLERQSWARMLCIVLGFLSLVNMPFGTALGIYTLWVMLPNSSEMEYRQMARS